MEAGAGTAREPRVQRGWEVDTVSKDSRAKNAQNPVKTMAGGKQRAQTTC